MYIVCCHYHNRSTGDIWAWCDVSAFHPMASGSCQVQFTTILTSLIFRDHLHIIVVQSCSQFSSAVVCFQPCQMSNKVTNDYLNGNEVNLLLLTSYASSMFEETGFCADAQRQPGKYFLHVRF